MAETNNYIDGLVASVLDKNRQESENMQNVQPLKTETPQVSTPQYQPPTTLQPINTQPSSTQTESTDNNQNPYGYDEDTMNYLASIGWNKDRINALGNFDPNKGWNEQLKMFDYMKPQQLDEKALRNRRNWGAIGDSLKLLAQIGTSSAGAYIRPETKQTLTDYFINLDDRDKQRYLNAMNLYQRAVNQGMIQNQRDNYNQYIADRRNLSSILSNREKLKQNQAQFEASEKRRQEIAENQRINQEKNYELNKQKTESGIWANKQRVSQGWSNVGTAKEREKRLAAGGSGSGKVNQAEIDKIFYNEVMTDPNVVKTLPDSYFNTGIDRDRNPYKRIKDNTSVRKLAVEKYLSGSIGQNNSQQNQPSGSQMNWNNNSPFSPKNNPQYEFNYENIGDDETQHKKTEIFNKSVQSIKDLMKI